MLLKLNSSSGGPPKVALDRNVEELPKIFLISSDSSINRWIAMGYDMLEGVTVLDTTNYAAGSFCTKLNAESGAQSIKVDIPKVGEPALSFPKEQSKHRKWCSVFPFGHGKKSATINISSLVYYK